MRAAPTRAALVTAEPAGAVSGNNATIERVARRLRGRGLDVTLLRLPEVGSEGAAIEAARAGRPQVVHALHARHAGPVAAAVARALRLPLVVSSGGTDIDQDTHDPARAATVAAVLAQASALLVTHGEARERAQALTLCRRVLRVPKGVEPPPPRPPPDPERFGVRAQEFLFVLPGGVRAVKNQRFPLEPLARLQAEGLPVRLLLVGPERDSAYAADLRRDLARHPFAAWPGVAAAPDMEVLYATASVVLNVSHTEGGANVVLEAMARGGCVLASSVPGNADLLEARAGRPEAGRLYRAEPTADPRVRRHDPEDFLRHARALVLSPVLRAALAEEARDRAAREHDPEAEADGILLAYRLALSDGPSA